MQHASRIKQIAPFYVMDLLAKARQLEAEGRDIVHLEVGEPDFSAPEPVVQATVEALQQGLTHYTPALGLPALRQAIAGFYQRRYGVAVASEQVAVTPGASGALQLVLGALINPGDEVVMADPGYPCNRHFVRLFGGREVSVPVDHHSNYQLTAELLEPAISPATKAVMVASPSNPTGTVLSREALENIYTLCQRHGVALIVDEIYQGLVYGGEEHSAAGYKDVFVINSFSKYFGMTGMRVGWVVAPTSMMEAIDRQAQNFFLAASTPAQYGALAALEPACDAILEQRRSEFQRRRDYLLPELRKLGFEIKSEPQGAFYLYADCSRFTDDSFEFCFDLLDSAGVAITPGRDFGQHREMSHLRFAYTREIPVLEQAVERLRQVLA